MNFFVNMLVKLDENDRPEEKRLYKDSQLKTYSERCHSHKGKAQEHQTTSRTCESLSSQSSVCTSASNLDAKESKGNELIDLFEEIRAEQLLIEPSEMHLEDGELRSNEPGSYNHREWLEKLSQNVRREKVSSKVGYILGGGGGGASSYKGIPIPPSPPLLTRLY